jgi:hypothetical protein
MINVDTVEATESHHDSVLILLLNTLLSQSGEEFSSLEPISDKEFYPGVMLIGAAILAFGLIVRIIGI